MKKLILFAAIFAATNLQAQVDTVRNAIQVKPVVVNALQKDTCQCFSDYWPLAPLTVRKLPLP